MKCSLSHDHMFLSSSSASVGTSRCVVCEVTVRAQQDTLACRPTCEIFAVDAAYSSGSPVGLATDRSFASFTVACTHNIAVCEHCVTVIGPPTHRIEQFAPAGMLPGEAVVGGGASCSAEHTRSRVYEGKVVWDETYRGIVRISLENSRCVSTPGCLQPIAVSFIGYIPGLQI